jgi:C-terminal processing protease CtpA/Prc
MRCAIQHAHWFLFLAFALAGHGQTLTRQNIASILGFENGQPGAFPAGWSGGPADTIVIDNQIVHNEQYSARIERDAASSAAFSTLTAGIPLDFAGRTVLWGGYIKTENVSDSVALWVSEGGPAATVVSSATQAPGVKGTTDWRAYSISVPVLPDGKQLTFGIQLTGTGKAWVDGLVLLVDGKPAAQAPDRTVTVLDTDHQFDDGSGIALTGLTDLQIKNLATLAKVWGFLKYHHPAITAGGRHWDYDLFRVLPPVLAAVDSASANLALSSWIAGLGPVAECSNCATLDTSDLYMAATLDWIGDTSLLGADLSQTLGSIYRNRTPAASQFFVSLAPGIFNPYFDHELGYYALNLPDAGYQILGLFRFWNMVRYFYPNRDVIANDGEDAAAYWNRVLEEAVPRIALATDSPAYQRELMRFVAHVHDTHSNLWFSNAARPPVGDCRLPFDIRFVEGSALVIPDVSGNAGADLGLMPGDIIQQLDGMAVDDLVGQWKPFYAASNESARLRDIGDFMTRGSCGPAAIVARRADATLNIAASRVPASTSYTDFHTHDLPGDTFQMLSNDVAYLKLSSATVADSAAYIRAAAGTKGLIVDIRNYPAEFVIDSLGSLLVSQPVDFARATYGDATNPGAFHWVPVLGLTPLRPHYTGKVVILVDERTQSQAEFLAMAFRTAPGAIVIGSTTAGADGNVSTAPFPGGFSTYISGIGIFYPDNRPTQRVGIVPDIEVKPTIAGIQAGRDELIEEAIRQIAGGNLPAVQR